jgi:hypothetical protein
MTSMPLVLRAATLALAAIVLAACNGVRVVNYGQPFQPASANYFLGWAGAAGPVLVEVRDSPFADSDLAVAAAIAEATSGALIVAPVRFTARSTEASHPAWRVVYDFDIAPSTAAAAVCDASRPTPRGNAGEGLSALVVFCNDTKPIMSAGAWSPPIAGVATPEFRSFAYHSMQGLFPVDSYVMDPPNNGM